MHQKGPCFLSSLLKLFSWPLNCFSRKIWPAVGARIFSYWRKNCNISSCRHLRKENIHFAARITTTTTCYMSSAVIVIKCLDNLVATVDVRVVIVVNKL